MNDHIPLAMRERPQWIVWRTVERGDKPTKVPFNVATDKAASSTDQNTWSTFDAAVERFNRSLSSERHYDGIGYVFSPGDPFCGVDLDGCRDKATGKVADWAREIIKQFDTYSEVSPSGEGVKLFMVGKLNRPSGRKTESLAVEKVGGKEPGIEVYDHARYFAVTGKRLAGVSPNLEQRQVHLDLLAAKYFPEESRGSASPAWYSDDAVIDRARKYTAAMPQAVSGQRGHDKCFAVACVLVLGFGLRDDQAYALLTEWSQKSTPPWSERELRHKIQSAGKQPGERNYLRNARQDQYCRINVPKYVEEKPPQELRVTTLADASVKYLDELKQGNRKLVEFGLPDVDYAIAGGVEFGEMVILAARPSHGKSAVALQMVYQATRQGLPAIVLSEEMSALALGKRQLQFASDVPEEHWRTSDAEVRKHLQEHLEDRKPCYVVESAGSAQRAADAVREYVETKGVRFAVVDYAQLLTSPGKARYEQITNTSVVLRQLATETKVILVVLCQLNREIEKRNRFVPTLSDIKDTGQLEQDADVIMFLVWPHRINQKNHPDEMLFFVSKNRNRAINAATVKCIFKPARQMVLDQRSSKSGSYDADSWEPQQSYTELFGDNGHAGF